MTELVRYEVAAGIATITMDNPPLNALSHGLQAGLWSAVERAEAEAEVKAIVLRAQTGLSWPVGADIREFGKPAMAPTLPDLNNKIVALSKPLVAAIQGQALGGGLELALVAAARVAATDVRLALPEVKLGLLPGAGGTQRLPRLIGAKAALNIMLTGTALGAAEALSLGLVDLVADGDVARTARAVAEAHVSGQAPLPPAARRQMPGLTDAVGWLHAVAEQQSHPRGHHEKAARRIVAAVEAALLLPPDQGLALERVSFAELLDTPESRALRHLFFAERRAAKSFSTGRDTVLKHVSVVGAGTIGSGIASELLRSGLSVTVIEADRQALSVGLARIARLQEAAVQSGDMTEAQRQDAWERLRAAARPKPLAGSDLVIEAVSEDLEVKSAVLSAINTAIAPDVPVFSVSCGLEGAVLAAASGRKSAHGMVYLTGPVRRLRVLEVVVGADAEATVLPAARALASRLGWKLVRGTTGGGFLGKRLWSALSDAADRCLAMGAAPHEVDRAARALGLPLGPYEMRDLYGVDHDLITLPLRREGIDAHPVALELSRWLAAQGRTGRRDGKGYYRYGDGGRQLQGDPEVIAALQDLRLARKLGSEDLQRRLIAGLANQGAWALGEGLATRPGDIDVAALNLGFARWQGGPMQGADEAGLLLMRNDLRDWAAAGDRFWEPAPLWSDLIREGKKFGDLDASERDDTK